MTGTTDLALAGLGVALNVGVAWVLAAIALRDPSPHLRPWAAAFGCVALWHLAELFVPADPARTVAAAVPMLSASVLLLDGTWLLDGRRTPRPLAGLAVAAAAWAVVAGLAGARPLAIALPAVLLAGIADLVAGAALALRRRGLGDAIAGLALLSWGLERLASAWVPEEHPAATGFASLSVGVGALVAVGLVLAHTDRAALALAASEARYRTLFARAPDGVYRTTADGRFVEANAALVRMLGYDRVEDVLALDLVAQVYADPTERGRIVERLEVADEADVETEWRRRDGTTIRVSIHGRRLRGSGGETVGYDGVVRDVTADREERERRTQIEKLDAVSRLAAAVAHDFNNLLAAMTGNAEMVAERLRPGSEEREDLEVIVDAGRRASTLTRQLVALGRTDPMQVRPFDVNELIRSFEHLFAGTLGPSVSLVVHPAPAPAVVEADPAQLEQVVLNLVMNARAALPEGGTVAIHTTLAEDVVLEVTDDGVGMDEHTKKRAFEPFFTTRASGSGLGLASVYGIVARLGGDAAIDSAPGRGTTVRVRLPRSLRPPEALAGPHTPLPVARDRTVLLVEDDPAVMRALTRMLERGGYTVVPARSAAEAQARVESGPPDALVTDLVMPGTSGADLLAALRQRWPELPAVLVTGWTSATLPSDARTRVLQKPFSAIALLEALGAVLAVRA